MNISLLWRRWLVGGNSPIRHAVVGGCLALVLQLVVAPLVLPGGAAWLGEGAAHGAPPGDVGAQGGVPTRKLPPLDFSRLRFYSQQELLGIHQSVFETLFTQPWDEGHWEYRLEAPVSGIGFYSGTNQYGQPFELEILVHARVDLSVLPLSPPNRAWADQNRFSNAGVIGRLVSENASIAVHGFTVTSAPAGQPLSSRFWLVNTVDPNSPIFTPPPDPDMTGFRQRESFDPPAPFVYAEPDNNCDQCQADHVNRVRLAEQRFTQRVRTAEVQRDADIQDAWNQYNIDREQADNQLEIDTIAATTAQTVCLLGCAATGPAALPCVLACSAGYAILIAQATLTHQNVVNAAATRRDNAINAARERFEGERNAAARERDQAVQQSTQTLRECLLLHSCSGGSGQRDQRMEPEP